MSEFVVLAHDVDAFGRAGWYMGDEKQAEHWANVMARQFEHVIIYRVGPVVRVVRDD